MKDKYHIIMPTDAEKSWQNSASIHDKKLNKVSRGEVPQHDKGHTANLILSTQWWKAESFFLRLGTRQGGPLSPLLFSIVLEVLNRH